MIFGSHLKDKYDRWLFWLSPQSVIVSKVSIYLQDGRLEIDNNLIENSIRPVALGRKKIIGRPAPLFAGSHSGAEKAAMVYSLLGSCKQQNTNPYDYLQDVLERLPEHPVNRLHELLPPNWKPAKVNITIGY